MLRALTISAALAGLASAGCVRTPPPSPGGAASATLGGIASPTRATVDQPANPSAPSAQTVERSEVRQEVAAPVIVKRITETPAAPVPSRIVEEFAPPVVLTQSVTEKTGTQIGPAFRDDSRQIAAKLSAARPVQLAGAAFLLLALASFHPVVRTVLGGGKTIPALAAVIGLVLVFGPSALVGNERLALTLAAGGLGVAYLVVRLSHKEGQLDASQKMASVSTPSRQRREK